MGKFPGMGAITPTPPARCGARRNSRESGISITELLVALVIVGIAVIAGINSFKQISRAISISRTKTLATNLAQEQVEILKALSYFQLLVTSTTATDANYTPNVIYDTSNYPAQTYAQWSVPLRRSVFVAYADVTNNVVSTVPYTSQDTGFKQVIVDVTWKNDIGTYGKVELKNLFENPTAATLNSGINGVVNVSGGSALASAFVQVIGQPQWQAYTDTGGNYTFQVSAGTYTVLCSSKSYYSQTSASLTVARGAYTTAPTINLVAIGTGTVSGDVWISSNLVISQVVASTGAANIEFVELFNPTTYQIQVSNTQLFVGNGNNPPLGTALVMTYNNLYASASSYYLIASTSPINMLGVSRTADAQYTVQADLISTGLSGGVQLQDSAGRVIDSVAWQKSGGGGSCPAAFVRGSCINVNSTGGLQDGEQIVRMSGPNTLSSSYGRAYQSNNNINNFMYFTAPLTYVHNNSAISMPVVSGSPAYGAYVVANDGNSVSTAAVTYNASTYPYAKFTLVGVATGTWTVTVTSSTYMQQVSTVAVTQNATTAIPNAATTPAWPAAGSNELSLTSGTSGGYAQGYVYGSGSNYWTPLSGILVASGSSQVRTTSSGYFILSVSTGSNTVTANFNTDNPNYSVDNEIGTVNQGQAVYFPANPYIHLSQAGFIKGYVTSGTGALPNIVVTATLGGSVYSATSDNTGYFYVSASTSSSAYTIAPQLDPTQSYSTAPSSPLTATLTNPASTVFAGTVTVTGAMATIAGNVTYNSNPINTGVLVVASVGAVSDPPPAIYASSSSALTNPYYSIASKSDGSYSLSVAGGSTYNLRAYYPVVDLNSGAATYTTKTLSGISTSAGVTTSGNNFSFP